MLIRSQGSAVLMQLRGTIEDMRDPSEPLGTHTFVMRHVPDADSPTWTAVAMPGHFDAAGRDLSAEAAARVSLPGGFARAVGLLVEPGSTLFVTDAPILAENMHPEFTVLSDGAPEESTLD